jgi:3,4-dihydroxy 2-butanone 4-phosphate synthase
MGLTMDRLDTLPAPLQAAAEALRKGQFVLLFDQEGREEETDLMISAAHTTPQAVRRMRQDGGGLVFVAVGHTPATAWGLPFAHDVQAAAAQTYPLLDRLTPKQLPYDQRSSFSLWVNHRDTYTGITDKDRARTISQLAGLEEQTREMTTQQANDLFAANYRSPGHVPLCIAHPEGLSARQGHTELATALAEIAGIPPIVAGCEMLAPDKDTALERADAEKYARQHGLVLLEGEALMEGYETWRATRVTHDG